MNEVDVDLYDHTTWFTPSEKETQAKAMFESLNTDFTRENEGYGYDDDQLSNYGVAMSATASRMNAPFMDRNPSQYSEYGSATSAYGHRSSYDWSGYQQNSFSMPEVNSVVGYNGGLASPEAVPKNVLPLNVQPNPVRQTTDDKRYFCNHPECSARFKTATHLRRHQTTHSTDKPFACGFQGCHSRFTRSDNQKQHERHCKFNPDKVHTPNGKVGKKQRRPYFGADKPSAYQRYQQMTMNYGQYDMTFTPPAVQTNAQYFNNSVVRESDPFSAEVFTFLKSPSTAGPETQTAESPANFVSPDPENDKTYQAFSNLVMTSDAHDGQQLSPQTLLDVASMLENDEIIFEEPENQSIEPVLI